MKARFPDDLPLQADAELPAAAEAAVLLALAEELRRAHPHPEVSAEFGERLQLRLSSASGLRAVLRSSRLARAAATLLVVSVSVAPVLALVQILPWLRETRLVIQVEQRLLPPLVAAQEEALPPLPAPHDPSQLDAAWVEAMTRQNRMARAAASWFTAGAPQPRASSIEPSTWDGASAEDLWQEFLRRCARGGTEPLPAALVARIEVLGLVGSAEERRLLAPWTWVLRGAPVPAAEADQAQAWAAAPWIAEE